MQVSASTITPIVFHPIELQILLESKAEINAVQAFMYYKQPLLLKLFPMDSDKYRILHALFTQIENNLKVTE